MDNISLKSIRKALANENDRSILANMARSAQILVGREHRMTSNEICYAKAVTLKYHIFECIKRFNTSL
jgi:hypothetical protein